MLLKQRITLFSLIFGLSACGGGSDHNDESNPLLPSGLAQRPENPSCLAPPRPQQSIRLTLEAAFPQLSFQLPLGLLQAPGDDSRWFILEQLSGLIKQFANRSDAVQAEIFLDISDRVFNDEEESGLLGMAFHPDFPATPYVYVSYTRQGAPLISYISRFTSPDGGHSLDSSSEQVLLTLDQPSKVHQGGHIEFGPDAYLYIGFGDGGHPAYLDPNAPDDPFGHGQNTDTLFSALLRIDIDAGQPYIIPADNPFASAGGRPEIYAWGFRNPWRWSFDRATGELWLADVGETRWEEINRVERSGNYGWSLREGKDCFPPDIQQCAREDLIDPWYQYGHADGCAIIGGYVYRGEAIPELQGQYVFGDFCSGQVWRLQHDEQGQPFKQSLVSTNRLISAFGTDQAGELYLLDWLEGTVFRLKRAASNSPEDSFPLRLSQTGCVDPNQPAQPAEGLIPYSINAPFWSDGAEKKRWLALPDGATIHINSENHWEFPKGSVLLKNFYLADTLIETRLLVRHQDGAWAGYSYAWREDGSDADYVPGGQVTNLSGQNWIYPGSGQCLQCHTQAADFALGLDTAQMNRDHNYTSTGITANQLVTFNRIGLFNRPLAEQPERHPILADPFDSRLSLTERARAYLHSNCSQCHRPGGPTRSAMDLRDQTSLEDTNTCEQAPKNSSLGIENARLIAPGAPERSILLSRMNRRDIHRMPPLGSNLVDSVGVALIQDWLLNLAACQEP